MLQTIDKIGTVNVLKGIKDLKIETIRDYQEASILCLLAGMGLILNALILRAILTWIAPHCFTSNAGFIALLILSVETSRVDPKKDNLLILTLHTAFYVGCWIVEQLL